MRELILVLFLTVMLMSGQTVQSQPVSNEDLNPDILLQRKEASEMAYALFQEAVNKAKELGIVLGKDSTFSIEEYKGTVNPCLETEALLSIERDYFVVMFLPPEGTLGGGFCIVIDRVERTVVSKILG